MEVKKIEQIIKDLKSTEYGTKSNLTIRYDEDLPDGKAGLNRNIFIEAENGEKLTIEWWKNILYIKYGKSIIPCDKIEVSSTWPNSSKLNIQASFEKNTIFILPILEWELKDDK